MKIISIVGARPQFIKAAAVSRVLKTKNQIHEEILHTGQHYDENMSSIFFQELSIPLPTYNLGVGSASHGQQTGIMLEKIENILLTKKPNLIVVYGDTNSTLAAALASVKLHIPVIHVEAGLRSFNRYMPEEINRIIVDQVSSVLFCPTETSVSNLLREGIEKDKIHLVGDVMYDAALFYRKSALRKQGILKENKLIEKNYVLATIHRAENTDNITILKLLFQQLNHLARTIPVVMPLHPRTLHILQGYGLLNELTKNITLIQPVSYMNMIILESNAKLIVTDSGGVQKEAYFYRVPCITVRDQTEWVELIDSEWNLLVPQAKFNLLNQIIEDRVGHYGKNIELYGAGKAANKIADIICSYI
ncbi:MAG: UDP-N-acetylglucosamine 2-epimerase (non-hydrolyzing) [Legionellales bacterium]|nr:UDP-N-acetylglucosamine 2-epimerase (non-hydrolyzing) [Legionellales bacterium]